MAYDSVFLHTLDIVERVTNKTAENIYKKKSKKKTFTTLVYFQQRSSYLYTVGVLNI